VFRGVSGAGAGHRAW